MAQSSSRRAALFALGKRALLIGAVLIAIGALVLVALGVYARVFPTETPDSGLTYTGFLDDLLTEGASVQEVGQGGPGQELPSTAHEVMVNGSKIIAYDYVTTRDAAQDAARISPDGSTIRSTQGSGLQQVTVIDFIEPPHWFHTGHVVVLYVGCDSALTELLKQVLGPPFAGEGTVDNPCPDPRQVTPTP